MNPDCLFKCIFRSMACSIVVHIIIYLWAVSQVNLDWCSRRITKEDIKNFDLNPPFSLNVWNYSWESKEQFWCGYPFN